MRGMPRTIIASISVYSKKKEILADVLANNINASLQMLGIEYQRGKLYNLPLIIFELISNLTAIISSMVRSATTLRNSSLTRPSFLRDKINDFFSCFGLDKPSPSCYIVSVCCVIKLFGGIMLDFLY